MKYLILTLSLFFIFCQRKKDIELYRVNYDPPYYVMAFGSGVFLYSAPSLDSEAFYSLSSHQILELHASLSLEDPTVLWYWVQEEENTDRSRKQNGYVEAKRVRIFETRQEARDFMTGSFSGDWNTLPYRSAEKLYKASKDPSLLLKEFLIANPKLQEHSPTVYYSSLFLLFRLVLESGIPNEETRPKIQEILEQIERLQTLSSSKQKTKQEILLIGDFFRPKRISFFTDQVEWFLYQNPFPMEDSRNPARVYQSRLTWELSFYRAWSYEVQGDYPKALLLYREILESPLEENERVRYFNLALDAHLRLSPEPSLDFLFFLKDFHEKIQRKNSEKNKENQRTKARYLFFLLAKFLERENRVEESVQYYNRFVLAFETVHSRYPYPRELDHYLLAQEKLKKSQKSRKLQKRK